MSAPRAGTESPAWGGGRGDRAVTGRGAPRAARPCRPEAAEPRAGAAGTPGSLLKGRQSPRSQVCRAGRRASGARPSGPGAEAQEAAGGNRPQLEGRGSAPGGWEAFLPQRRPGTSGSLE